MDRRGFLKRSAIASGTVLLPQFLSAFELAPSVISGHKKLVIVQLSGGNDGLNSIVPYRNDIYYRERPKIAVSSNDIIKATDDLGFHSSLKEIKELYDAGEVTIINNVGYPNPNRSHFRSTDIWHTASSSDEYLTSGWLGRYIENFGRFPHAGIEVDDSLSLIMKGKNVNGIATQNAQLMHRNMKKPFFNQVINQQTDEHLSEHNLGYLYKTLTAAKSSAKYLDEKTKTFNSKQEYPDNPFAKQLKTTARFINSNAMTSVYYVSMGGFDTHANQNNRQSRLLETYSGSMGAFIKDLKKSDTFKDTVVMVFSEFGRRVAQNSSQGTDHGTANQVYIIGEKLAKPGFFNNAPDLSQLDQNGDLKYQVDFREIYATLLDKWLEVDDQVILNKNFSKLQLV